MEDKFPQHAKFEFCGKQEVTSLPWKELNFKVNSVEECSQFSRAFSLKQVAKVHEKSLFREVRLLDKGDMRKVFIKFKEEGKVRIRRFLRSNGVLKAKTHISSNLKLNVLGKLVKITINKS